MKIHEAVSQLKEGKTAIGNYDILGERLRIIILYHSFYVIDRDLGSVKLFSFTRPSFFDSDEWYVEPLYDEHISYRTFEEALPDIKAGRLVVLHKPVGPSVCFKFDPEDFENKVWSVVVPPQCDGIKGGTHE